MDEKLLKDTFSSIEKKLGKENYAKIADDIGTMMTGNTQTLKEIEKRDAEITDLKKSNEALVASNGNLLKQVSMAPDPDLIRDSEPEVVSKPYDFRDAFDEFGNLKR